MYSETKDENEVDLFYFYHIVHSFTSFVHPLFLYLLCSFCVSLFPPSCVFVRSWFHWIVCLFLSRFFIKSSYVLLPFYCRAIAVPQLSSTTTRPLYPFNIHVRAYLKIVYLNNHPIVFIIFRNGRGNSVKWIPMAMVLQTDRNLGTLTALGPRKQKTLTIKPAFHTQVGILITFNIFNHFWAFACLSSYLNCYFEI